MFNDQALVAQGAVVGGDEDAAIGVELVAHGDKVRRAATKEYGAVYSICFQHFGEMQERGDTGAAANHQYAA